MSPSTFQSDVVLLVAALIQAWNTHDVDRVVALHAADYVGEDVSEAQPIRGRSAVRRSVERYLQAFPDLHWTVERTLEQGDEAVLIWTARGTHHGGLFHIPATGRVVEVRGISVLHVEAEKIRRGTVIWDVAGLLRKVGLLPALNPNL